MIVQHRDFLFEVGKFSADFWLPFLVCSGMLAAAYVLGYGVAYVSEFIGRWMLRYNLYALNALLPRLQEKRARHGKAHREDR